jgi:choice-of-anchor A domain-containing protein
MKFSSLSALMLGVCLSAADSSRAANVALDLIRQFNVITGDYSAGNETEGSAFVHGSYSPQGSSARFGFNGGQATHDSQNMLWLANGVSNGNRTTLITGSVVSQVPVSGSLFSLNGNAPGDPSVKSGQAAWNEALSGLGLNHASDVPATLEQAAFQWSGLAANSTGSKPGNGSYTFQASPVSIDGNQVAIFHVTAAELFGSGFDRLELNLNNAQTVLINVSGTNVLMDKNFANGFTNNESKILFNFYEAESLTVTRNFRGGIFAPFAAVTQVNTNIDGSVIAASLAQTAEIHDVRFRGYLPFTAVPEPSGAVLAMIGAALVMKRRRR